MSKSPNAATRPTHRSPGSVILLFLGGIVTLLAATEVLGQVNLPYVGKTAWDVACALVAGAARGVPLIAELIAGQYVWVVGALGVLWLSSVQLRVYRTRAYVPNGIDAILAVMAMGLFAEYFTFLDRILPMDAGFVYRVTLYCAISSMVFGVGLVTSYYDEKWDAEDTDNSGLPIFVVFVVCVASPFLTGAHGTEQHVSMFMYEAPNTILHLMANLGGFAMGAWFRSAAAKHSAEGLALPSKPSA